MQKFALAALAAGLALVLVGSASAYDTAWMIQMRSCAPDAGSGYDENAPLNARFGTGSGSPWGPAGAVDPSHIEVYCNDPDGAARNYYDVRATQLPSVTMVWNVSVHAGDSFDGGWFRLTAWNPSGSDIGVNPGFRVRLYKGDTMEYEFSPSANGLSASPQFDKLYEISASETISNFRLVRELPEPAGMLLVLAGLAPLLPVLRRKR